ncbi:MAG TPA: M20/M25/M40 family metallo-hydrolase, partial [Vicinamibacterales bacterium]
TATMKTFVLAFVTCAALAAPTAVRAQEGAAGIGARLMQEPAVKSAIDRVKRNEEQVIDDQLRLCEIPAPPFMEQARGEALRRAFTAAGLKNVRVDAVGNVIGDRPGLAPRPRLVFTAHLDTVFPEGTKVVPSREGSILKGPGIGDDCRGLAVLLAVIRELDAAQIQTPGTITFVATVGEEGLGDLRGVKHLFNNELKGQIDRFVSVDGSGLDITATAVGSLRYRVTFKGPGGHSYGAFGLANPVHALGRAIAHIGDLQVPSSPKTTFNVGRIGGGTSVNSIPFEAWMEVDMRSADAASLKAIDAGFHKAVDRALAEENERWNNNGRLSVEKKLVGDRPAGATPRNAAIVQAAVSVTKAIGEEPVIGEGSTDSNIAISLGIPAVTVDGGGNGSGAHSLAEQFDATDSWKGTARALLLAVALAQK